MDTYKVLLWGLGRIYLRYISFIRYIEKSGDIKVIGLTASNINHEELRDGYKVLPVEGSLNQEFDFIIILNEKHVDEIINTISSYGISRSKCLSYSILDILFFDAEKYFRLLNNPISIISNNCWGGIVYNTLHLECMSPFKNLFVEDADYIKLLRKLDYYLKCNPVFGGYDIDTHSHERYPVLVLDDVRIHCNHEKDPKTAIKNWNRRVRKVNYNNLFIEMYTENKQMAIDFLSTTRSEKTYCLSTYDIKDKRNIKLILDSGQELWEKVLQTAQSTQPVFQLLDILNGELIYR